MKYKEIYTFFVDVDIDKIASCDYIGYCPEEDGGFDFDRHALVWSYNKSATKREVDTEWYYALFNDGEERWADHGILHREDGPAVIQHDGNQEWYRNGKRYREDGPAVVNANGIRQYWYNKDGGLHREDGPAVILLDEDYQAWWHNGKLHREDGPAVIYCDGREEWWVNGIFIVQPKQA